MKSLNFSALVYGNLDFEDKANCGGVIISENVILTAAHCVDMEPVGADKLTVFQINQLDAARVGHSDQFSPEIQEVSIEKKLVHSDWSIYEKFKYFQNDIALLKLSEPLKFDETIAPICLPSADTTVRDTLTLAGWGKTADFTKAAILQKVNLNHVPSEECNELWRTARPQFPDHELLDTMVCAKGEKGLSDACQGDSGGPLFQVIDDSVAEEDVKYETIGAVSFGDRACRSNIPGIYTRISKYLDWIEDFVYENRP